MQKELPAYKFVAPRDTLELQLVQLWTELLDVEPIGVTDDFFDLGGHSLLAAHVMQQVKRQFGYTFPLMELFEYPTIEHIANLLREPLSTTRPSPVVAIRAQGSKRPFFLMHPVGGNVLCYLELARAFDQERPIFGLQAAGLNGEQEPFTSIEEMATTYVQALQALQPTGPYLIGGWSMGGLIALEVAQQLQRQGQEIALLTIIDSQVSGSPTPELVDEAQLLTRFVAQIVGSVLTRGAAPKHLQSLQEDDATAFSNRLRVLSPDAQLALTLQTLKELDLVSPKTDLTLLGYLLNVFKANVHATSVYQPKPYIGRLLFLGSEETVAWKGQGPSMGWDQLTTGPVEGHVLPGNHYSLLHYPTVRLLADHLAEALKECD